MTDLDKIISLEKLSRYHANITDLIDSKVNKLVAIDDIRLKQMIDDTVANLHIYCTNDDILSLFDTNTPDEPDTPEEPTGDFGIVTNDNSIVIDETQLENGTYTLRYVDSNDNIIDNFNEITTFEINN